MIVLYPENWDSPLIHGHWGYNCYILWSYKPILITGFGAHRPVETSLIFWSLSRHWPSDSQHQQFAQLPVEDANFDAIIEPLPRQGESPTWGGGGVVKVLDPIYSYHSNEKLNGTESQRTPKGSC